MVISFMKSLKIPKNKKNKLTQIVTIKGATFSSWEIEGLLNPWHISFEMKITGHPHRSRTRGLPCLWVL